MSRIKKETKVEDKKNVNKKSKSHVNRGLDFESKIEKRLDKLRKEGKIIAQKIPTDFTVIRRGAKIVSAFPKRKSGIDFYGSYEGYFLGIEAKQTQNKTSFPIRANIHDHQIKLIDDLYENGSLVYYLINFKTLNRAFLVHGRLINLKIQEGIKSLKVEWFENNGREFDSKKMDFDKYIHLNDIKNN
ncbi:MAG: Holliday junction resolvase RecU [Clostridioides difficile]|nr:Holliday junction resolvase RecU [Clostridioides difficile]